MRILQISALYPPYVIGGAELGAAELARGMADAGDDVHVVTLQPPDALRDVPAELRNADIPIRRLPLANLYWPYGPARAAANAASRALWHAIDTANPVMARRVASVVAELRPDCVLTHNLQGFSTAILPAIARTGIPVVHVLHDFSLLCPRTIVFRNGKDCGHNERRCGDCRLLTAPRHHHLESVSGVIGVSQAVLELHRSHGLFAKTPSRVIYNALPPHMRPLSELPQRPVTDGLHFGFLGRIDRPKGVEVLLEACSRLAREGEQFRVSLAGKGDPSYVYSLQERWPDAPVDYLGYVDPGKYLSTLDVLLFPVVSLEALGNVVFEAYSRGVPVIASRRGGIPENIVDGVTGLLIKPNSVDELVDRMRRVLRDRVGLKAMARSALEKSKQYTLERRVRQVRDFLGAVIDMSQRQQRS